MQSFNRALPHGYVTKDSVAGQEARCAAANYVYVRMANPAQGNTGAVVAAQDFTPRVSGNVQVTGCVSGITSTATSVVTLTIGVGIYSFQTTLSPADNGVGGTANTLTATLNHVFEGLAVGTEVQISFTWSVAGGVATYDPTNGQGSLFIQELPN